MKSSAQLRLPDGRRLEYRIRSSPRIRNLCLRITMDGLTVSAPRWLPRREIIAMVAGKSQWIAARLARLEETGGLFAGEREPPRLISLPALAENWLVEYRQSPARPVGSRTEQPGRVLVFGETGDVVRCQEALRRWLAQRAKEALGPLLDRLAAETGLCYSRLSVRNQRTRWGSCSAAGAISLNCKLLFLPPDLVRYVLVHELCHLREHNHTTSYWSLLRTHEPEAVVLHQRMRGAWQAVPAWAHPRRNQFLPGAPDVPCPHRSPLFP